MTQTLRRLQKATLAAIAAIIITLAVLSTAARMLLPHAEGLRESLEAIGLVGAEIQVERDADGRIRILGLDAMQGNDPHALTFFLSEGRFRLIDSRLRWRDLRNPALSQTLLIGVAELVNQGERHDLRLRARSSPAIETPFRIGALRVLGKLEGPAKHPERWSGQLYLKVEGEDLAIGGSQPVGSGLELRAKGVRLETWNWLDQGRLTESITDAGAEGLKLAVERAQETLRLGDLSTRARWQRQAEGWRLDLAELRLPGATAAAPTSAVLSYRRAGAGEAPTQGRAEVGEADATAARLFAAVGALPVGPLAELSSALVPDPAEVIAELGQGRIQGLARRLAVHLALTSDPSVAVPMRISDWRLQGAIEGVAIAAGAGIPPLSGLNLDVDVGPAGGWAQIKGRNAGLDLRPLFAHAQRLTVLEGHFAWRLMPAGSIHLWTRALRAETANIESLTRLSLCVHPSGANPFIDLHTRLRNGRIEALPNWLPVGIMDQGLEDWLLTAIVAGELESGDLLLRGPLEQFPFDDQQGRFLLELRAVDGVLDYGFAATPPPSATGMRSDEESEPLQWPPLQQLAATVRFEGRRLEIDVPSAEILGTQVEAGRVSLPDLWNPTYLTIDARGNGPLADGMHLLKTSPLARQLGGLAASAEVSGSGAIELQLGVPLNRALPFRYSGELIWEPLAGALADAGDAEDAGDAGEDALADELSGRRTLSINGTDLLFSDIEGRLQFDELGITAEAIQANLGRQALRVDVSTLDRGGDEARTEIELRGQTPVDRLAATLPTDLWQLASGRLDWRLVLALRNRDATEQPPPIAFDLSSGLEGLALSLPEPLGKSAGEQRPFRLRGRFQDRWPLELRLTYADLGALIEVDRGPGEPIRLRRLAVDLNGEPPALPPERSIEISGALETLDLEPWLDWIARTELNPLSTGSAEDALQLLPIRLEVKDLGWGALRLSDLDAVLTPEAAGRWAIQFSAEQSGRGEVRVPARGSAEPLQVRLQQLDLAPLVAASEASAPAAQGSHNDPRTFGRLDLEIEQLRYDEDLLGSLRMRSEPQPNGVRFEPLSLNGPHVDASGQADWTIDATDYVETSIELEAKSNAIGELLRESGFYSALSGAPGELLLELRWPGGPGELSLERARGALEMQVGAGRMLDMEPGVGRMLGILNTAALSRRLSLDFSDVFDDGFTFDQIHGDIAIGNGQARIRDLSIQAPPADVRITGRTDLIAGMLDQSVEVTPEIGVGLALAGTVAGGPVVGAAVFLADKVTDGGFERLGRYAYKVTGPWRDPVIRRVDTGGSPSVGNLFVDDDPAKQPSAAGAASPAAQAPEKPASPFLEDF